MPNGDEVIDFANAAMADHELIIATQDWHPRDHGSFAANHAGREPGEIIELGGLQQILWPVHCVQDSSGAEFAASLQTDRIDRIFQKGVDAEIDSYSGFFDNGKRRSTGLADYLQEQGAEELTVLGLATDYCVKFTALDGCELGFKTRLLVAGCRGVDLHPGDSERALQEMQAAGVQLID